MPHRADQRQYACRALFFSRAYDTHPLQRLADVLTTVRADHFDTILTQDAGTTGLDQPVGAGATTLRKIIGGLRRPKSLGICLPDGLFADLDLPEHDEPSAIGAPDDYRRYNDEPW